MSNKRNYSCDTCGGRMSFKHANRISLTPISQLWCDAISHLPHRYLDDSGGLLSDKANFLSTLMPWLMIIWNSSDSPQLCFTVSHSLGRFRRQPFIRSQFPPLFTRAIIQPMVAACLWCQIAHKEWFRCLLGEMVTNWCCGLSAMKGRSTYRNEAQFSESRQHCFVPLTHQNNMTFRKRAPRRIFRC